MAHDPVFYGHYVASTTSVSGCVKEFTSKEQKEASFPPQLQAHCSLCDMTHNFRLKQSWMVATPGQIKKFKEYCSNNNIEMDIEIPTKQ